MNFLGAVGSSKAISRSLLAIAAAGALLATTGCSGSPAATGTDLPATPEVKYVSAPLTGIRYVEGSAEALALVSPSVACKVDNSYDARPQQGLNSTDVVFDEMVEGGLTRLVAIWHSTKPDAVGPVRSIRPMDPDIISPFGGIVCYSGGQQAFVNAMRATDVVNASETSEQGNGTFSRSKDRFAPHNVIVNAAKLASLHPELAAPQAMWDFAPDLASATAVAATGSAVSAVTSVKVKYPDATALWTWSANTKAMAGEAGAWVRTQDGKAHIDKATGEQVRATNIVVLDVKIDRSYADRKYGNVPKTVMVGSGDAWVFTGGKLVEAKWQKSAQTGRIILTDGAGAAIALAPGNTWVELKPAAPEGAITVVSPAAPSPSPTK